MATQPEQEAFLWLQGRMIELLLRHDAPRLGDTFGERHAALFDDARHTPLRPYRELAVLFYLRDELFGSILPRIKRRLSFLAPHEMVEEVLPPRGRIDWPRTMVAGLRDRPGEPPIDVQARQRRRLFATAENVLTVATILEYRNLVQARLDVEAASDAGQTLRHPLREIVDGCTRELAFPQFTGLVRRCERIVEGYADQTVDDLDRLVAEQLLPGRNSAYDDLIVWRRRLAELRLLTRDGVPDVPPMLGAEPADDNYLYQLWLFYEIGELLQRRGFLERWDLRGNQLVFHWGEGGERRRYLLRHDRAIDRHWDKAPGVRPDLYIVRTDRRIVFDRNTQPARQLIWRDPGFVLDAKYYKPRGSRRAPGDTVKRMIADLHLTGERHGALLFAFQRDEGRQRTPDEEADIEPDADLLVQHAEPLYSVRPGVAAAQTSIPDVQIDVWRVRPAIGAELAAHTILAAVLERAHQALSERRDVRCHGVFLDTLSAAERTQWHDRGGAALVEAPEHHMELVVCPKPHIGTWRVDLVRRDLHCLRAPQWCHIMRQQDAQKPLRPPRDIDGLLNELAHVLADQPAGDLDEETMSAVAERVQQLTRRYAELERIDLAFYHERVRALGMRETFGQLQPPEQESLALAIFLADQLFKARANDYSAPAIHLSSVIEIEVKRRVFACPDLAGDLANPKRQTLGVLPFLKRANDAYDNWTRISDYAHARWQMRPHPDNPDREISFADFIDKALNRISQLRNNAAHTEPLSRHLYDELHDVVFQGKRLGLGALNTLLIAWPL